jgi:hypothetical protein
MSGIYKEFWSHSLSILSWYHRMAIGQSNRLIGLTEYTETRIPDRLICMQTWMSFESTRREKERWKLCECSMLSFSNFRFKTGLRWDFSDRMLLAWQLTLKNSKLYRTNYTSHIERNPRSCLRLCCRYPLWWKSLENYHQQFNPYTCQHNPQLYPIGQNHKFNRKSNARVC